MAKCLQWMQPASGITESSVISLPAWLIVEVTAAPTLRKDYLEKALSYQSIDSLQAYLIVAQDKPQVDMLFRAEDRSWQLQQFSHLEDELVLPCPDMTLTLAMVYSGIEF